MSSWGMDAGALHAQGGQVADLQGDAQSAARSLLGAVNDGAGAVHHALVSGALGRFHDTWSKDANQLVSDVEKVGAQLRGTAATGVSADADAYSQVSSTAPCFLSSAPSVLRPINVC